MSWVSAVSGDGGVGSAMEAAETWAGSEESDVEGVCLTPKDAGLEVDIGPL